MYTPYEGLNLANQISRKFGVFELKLEGNHSLQYCYFEKKNETMILAYSVFH